MVAWNHAEMEAETQLTEEIKNTGEETSMKKWFSILLTVAMLGVVACAAWADEVPQPEGGKKFESNWAVPGGFMEIVYEEEGYRISLDILDGKSETGATWEYSCFYHEDTDSLKSVNSSRTDYTYDPVTNGRSYIDPAYDGMDEENQVTEFTIDKDGFLLWKDGHDDAGAGLKFMNISEFEGVWENEAEEVNVEIRWNGNTADEMFYTIFLTRGNTHGERYADFIMNGTYDSSIGKLTALGTCTLFTKQADGEYKSEEDGKTYEAIFSRTGDGKILYETENGILLEHHEGWV